MPSSMVTNGNGREPHGVRCTVCELRRLTAFRDKSPEEIAFIDSMKIAHRFVGAGQDIIHLGQEDAELFTLYRGWAFRYASLPDGRRQILNFLLPGDILGLQASLLTAAEHGIEALTEVEVCVFSRRKTWQLFERMPQLSYELAWLGAREQGLVDQSLVSVGQRNAKERMAFLIIGLYRRLDRLGLTQKQSFAFPLKHRHLADALGLSMVHTVKTWTALRRAGLFQLEGGILTLVNPRLTENLAGYYDREWTPRPMI